MTVNNIQVFVLALSAAVLIPLLINFLSTSYNADSAKRFFWGDRNLGGLFSGSLISSTAFAMNGVLYFFWLGYWIGFAALLFQVFWCASYIWVRKYADVIQSEAKHGTLHGILGNRFGYNTGVAAALASITGFLLMLGWEVSIATALFAAVSDNAVVLTGISFLLAVGAAVYTSLGGLRGNVNANAVQNILAALALLCLTGLLIPDSFLSLIQRTEAKAWTAFMYEFGLIAIIANALFSLLSQFVDMSLWQSLAATKEDHKSSKIALWGAAGFVFFFPGLIGTIAGIALRAQTGIDDANIVDRSIELVSYNPWITGFVLVGLFSATLSTLDGLLLSASQALTWDIMFVKNVKALLPWWKIPSSEKGKEPALLLEEERKLVAVSRLVLPILAVIGTGTVLWLSNYISPFDLIYIAISAQLALFPLVYRLLKSPGHDHYGVFTIVFGLLAGTTVVWYAVANKAAGAAQFAPIATVVVAYLTYRWEKGRWSKGQAATEASVESHTHK